MRFLTLILSALLAAGLLGGCATAPHHPALQGDVLVPLIPARAFFANTEASGNHQISPDGQHLAWTAVWGTGPALWVRALEGGAARVVAQGVTGFVWAQDSRHVLYGRDQGGNENYHVMRLDTQTSGAAAVDLTPHAGTAAYVHRVLVDDPMHILVLHNQRDKRRFDLYRIHLLSGEQTLVLQNPGDAVAVVTDRAGQVVGMVRQNGEERVLHAGATGLQDAREVLRWGATDTVSVLGLDAARTGFYLLSSVGRARRALTHLDLASGRETLVHEDPQVDLDAVQMSAVGQRPLATRAAPDYQRMHVLDEAWAADLARWFPQKPRRLVITSHNRAETLFTALVDTDTERRFVLLQRGSGSVTLLGQSARNAYRQSLGVMRPVALTARDGLALHGYLTLPPGERPAPGPLVLLVHGGPWARDYWDNSMGQVQFLVNRGYAVLQVNYRGSAGYGRRFTQAAVGEFAGRMQDDLHDAVAWAVAQGVADPRKVAIMGASYGGYAALVGLSFTPQAFACGVDIVGVSNLVSLVENFPPYWESSLGQWHRFVGNPADPVQRRLMMDKSPISRVSDIERPLLVIQTRNDVRVRQEQSDQMVQALRAQGKPVDYLLLDNAGHMFHSWNWGKTLRAHRAVEDFLAGCLGGRSGGMDFFELAAWLF